MEELKKQASNIDEQGNVLYLDQERLDRKEVGFPRYKNKSHDFVSAKTGEGVDDVAEWIARNTTEWNQ